MAQNKKRLTKEAVDNAISCLEDSWRKGNEVTGLYRLKLKNLRTMRRLVINAESATKNDTKTEEGSFAT